MRKQLKKMNAWFMALVIAFQIIPMTVYAAEGQILTEEVINYLSKEDYVKAYRIAEDEDVFNKGYTQEELDEYFTNLYLHIYENKMLQRSALPSGYSDLNSAEKKLVLAYPSQAATVYMCSNEAVSRTITEYGYNGADDCSDAFRHALWNALMTNSFASSEIIYNISNGRMYAKMWADAHEVGNEGTLAYTMDLHNNSVGRNAVTKLSSSNELQSIIRNKVDSGACKYIKNGVLYNTYDVN